MSKSRIIRWSLFILGWISFILGTIGIIIPVFLPTVPFYLLTSYCWIRSSEKFHNWFIATKLYKNHVKGFATNRAMSLKGELMLLLFVSGILMLGIYFSNNYVVSIILPIVISIKYIYFVFRVNPVNKAEFALINHRGDLEND